MLLSELLGKRIKLVVTQEDIDNGIAGNCSKCPVAIALKRILSSLENHRLDNLITIEKSTIVTLGVSPDYKQIMIRHSRRLSTFIRLVDKKLVSRKPKPGVYYVTAEEKYPEPVYYETVCYGTGW